MKPSSNVSFTDKVDPTMDWNRLCGNAYTASLWLSVARALVGRQPGEHLAAFFLWLGFWCRAADFGSGSTSGSRSLGERY